MSDYALDQLVLGQHAPSISGTVSRVEYHFWPGKSGKMASPTSIGAALFVGETWIHYPVKPPPGQLPVPVVNFNRAAEYLKDAIRNLKAVTRPSIPGLVVASAVAAAMLGAGAVRMGRY